MPLTDVRIEKFGSLKNVSIENLSNRVTIFWGPNGSGKSTFVRFLRGLLFGFQRNSGWGHSVLETDAGYARVLTEGGPRRLSRSWSGNSIEQFSIKDEFDRSVVSGQGNSLPTWITEDVFQQIFTVGPDEAEQFELLTRLCMDSGIGRTAGDAELRQAEAALIQTARDRDGSGIQGGVVHRISELRRRQGDLQNEITSLRRPSADLPGRIEHLIREIDAATKNIERIDMRIREIDAEILCLEQRLNELRLRTVLPLNRQSIQDEIRTETTKLEHWREIRALIGRQCESYRANGDRQSRPMESARTIRAIISRLEERALQTLTVRLHGSVDSECSVRAMRMLCVICEARLPHCVLTCVSMKNPLLVMWNHCSRSLPYERRRMPQKWNGCSNRRSRHSGLNWLGLKTF